MSDTTDPDRPRELLARAIRHAEVYRDKARQYEHDAREWERAARRWQKWNIFMGCWLAILITLTVLIGLHR